MTLPVALYTAHQCRQLDHLATLGGDPSGYELMCRAGSSCFDLLTRRWPGASLDIVCGAGNNAGDGYVVARLARSAGIKVRTFALADPASLSGEAAQAYGDFVAGGGRALTRAGALTGGVVVDAVLGTGVSRNLSGKFAAAVARINASGRPVLAVDIPSGLSADSGAVLGSAVQASVTLTFIGLKQGLFTAAGPQQTGSIEFDDLQLPSSVYAGLIPSAWRIDQDLIAASLPQRPADSHKGTFGRVLVVGGNRGMPGAVRLSGAAALRSGAGVVQIATHPTHVNSVGDHRPELMVSAVADGAELAPLLDQADVVAVGPGLGTDSWAKALWQACLQSAKPLIVDADALNLLATAPLKRDGWILTPHPGELARLLRQTTATVQADRFAMAQRLQQAFGGVAVIKGTGTLVNDGDSLRLCSLGNPGMATAGMGDVLTGIIAALLGQGLTLAQASAVGVVVHAAAGDLAAMEGQRGLLAMDVVERLRKVVNP